MVFMIVLLMLKSEIIIINIFENEIQQINFIRFSCIGIKCM